MNVCGCECKPECGRSGRDGKNMCEARAGGTGVALSVRVGVVESARVCGCILGAVQGAVQGAVAGVERERA